MFRLASMTKAVTSVATMILVEEGKIGLDDPVSRFLPEFSNLRVRGPDGTEAHANRSPTIRERLTHTAGLSYNFINNGRLVDAYREARVTDGLDQPEVTTAEAMRRLASAPLGYQPGTSWEYSLATDVLGAVIEKITGGTLGAFVYERAFAHRELGFQCTRKHASAVRSCDAPGRGDRGARHGLRDRD